MQTSTFTVGGHPIASGWMATSFYLLVNGYGDVVNWSLWFDIRYQQQQGHWVLGSSYGTFTSHVDQTAYCLNDSAISGVCNALYSEVVLEQPGVWTKSVVPLPPTVWLLSTGLAGLGVRRWLKCQAA
jgi:hypothetical protein